MFTAVKHYSTKLFLFFFYALENENHSPVEDSDSREVVVTDTPIGIRVTTVATYNKDFVPPATRLLRRVKSFFDPTDSPPPEK